MTNLEEFKATLNRVQRSQFIDRSLERYLRMMVHCRWTAFSQYINHAIKKTTSAEYMITNLGIDVITEGDHADVIDELKSCIECWLKKECEVI